MQAAEEIENSYGGQQMKCVVVPIAVIEAGLYDWGQTNGPREYNVSNFDLG